MKTKAQKTGTVLLYMYRDASNYKAFGRAYFSGWFSEKDKQRFLALLDQDGCFDIINTCCLHHPVEIMASGFGDDHGLMEVATDWIWDAACPEETHPVASAEIEFETGISFRRFVDEFELECSGSLGMRDT